ncbi:MAG: isoprenyl transferase [Peptoniphilaceae bacterium]|nr:isoprenyl transferase [Peptoniphilaceae bacterium]MDY6019074.1 isoprenyl transferase [Anaerococcus sp.]
MKEIKIPDHVAIILDGNGRWAKKRNKPRTYGHKIGADNVVDIALYAKDRGVKYLTLYAFSTENWKRPEKEVSYLMRLLFKFIETKINLLIENNVKLNILGDISRLPDFARKSCIEAMEKTKNYDGLYLNMALNYGGRADIVRAVKAIVKEGIEAKAIDEATISNHLYTKSMPDPDLMIRTGGDFRISNFLIYQLAYTELYFTPVLWPDFTKEEFDLALEDFSRRDRRYGGVNESD